MDPDRASFFIFIAHGQAPMPARLHQRSNWGKKIRGGHGGPPLRKMQKKFDIRGRRSIRLKGWDYSSPNFYFITLCVQNRESLFGEILNGGMTLNNAGKIMNQEWQNLRSRFNYMELDEYIIMPNHIHAILHIIRRGESCIRPGSCIRPKSQGDRRDQGEHEVRPYGTTPGSLGRIIQAFKSKTTKQNIKEMEKSHWPEFYKRLWQRNYYEHIIRNENELQQTRKYIRNNPANWSLDEENPATRESASDGDK